MLLALSCFGAWVSRMCGGGWPASVINFRFERFIYPIPYAFLFAYDYALMLICYWSAYAGKVTGHGQYLGMGYRVQDSKPEKMDFIVGLFMGEDVQIGQYPSYWRCVLGMTVTGVAERFVAGLLYAGLINPLYGVCMMISGAFKAVGYMFGAWVYHEAGFKKIDANVYGELFNGFVAYGVIGCLLGL